MGLKQKSRIICYPPLLFFIFRLIVKCIPEECVSVKL